MSVCKADTSTTLSDEYRYFGITSFFAIHSLHGFGQVRLEMKEFMIRSVADIYCLNLVHARNQRANAVFKIHTGIYIGIRSPLPIPQNVRGILFYSDLICEDAGRTCKRCIDVNQIQC